MNVEIDVSRYFQNLFMSISSKFYRREPISISWRLKEFLSHWKPWIGISAKSASALIIVDIYETFEWLNRWSSCWPAVFRLPFPFNRISHNETEFMSISSKFYRREPIFILWRLKEFLSHWKPWNRLDVSFLVAAVRHDRYTLIYTPTTAAI